ncbi:MAG: hypothetical protein AAGJ83_07115, partial [Planctomycetota bacterium]
MTERNESKLRHPVETPAAGTAPRSRKRKASRRQRSAAERGRRLRMESLEDRRLLAVLGGLGFDPPPVDPSIIPTGPPRNVGTVDAFQVTEQEQIPGQNNSINTAELLPLGTLPGQEDTIDLRGEMVFDVSPQGTITQDNDFYAVDLRAGDILDISLSGAGASFAVLYGNGQLWWGTSTNTAIFRPAGSPLMSQGTA